MRHSGRACPFAASSAAGRLVAGRAGRKGKTGLVILQTKSPDIPVIKQVVQHDYEGMYNEQLAERQLFRYPPFYRLIHVYLKHHKEDVVEFQKIAFQIKKLSDGERMALKNIYNPKYNLLNLIINHI